MIENDDNLIVTEILKGNSNAFGILINRYQGPLFRYLQKSVKDCEAAKDILQNVFIKAYENLDSFDSHYKFFSWIYRIAVNESINHLKSQRSLESFNDDARIIYSKDNPSEMIERKEVSELVDKALAKLNPDFKTIVILKHYQNFSYQEISEITGLSEKKVKSRLYMARQTLKNILFNNFEV